MPSTSKSSSLPTLTLGAVMALAGLFLLLRHIHVGHAFGWGSVLYSATSWTPRLTTGGMLIPLLLGVGWVFFDPKSFWAWALTAGALAALLLGILMSLQFRMSSMTLMDLLGILVLGVGGLGLMARARRAS